MSRANTMLATLVQARQERLERFQECVKLFLCRQPTWLDRLNPFSRSDPCPNLLHAPLDLENRMEITWILIKPSEWKKQMIYSSDTTPRDAACIALFYNNPIKPTPKAYPIDTFGPKYPLYIDFGLEPDWIFRKKTVYCAVALDKEGNPIDTLHIYYMGATHRGIIRWKNKDNQMEIIKRPFAIDLHYLPWFTDKALKEYETYFKNMYDKTMQDETLKECVPPYEGKDLSQYPQAAIEKIMKEANKLIQLYTPE